MTGLLLFASARAEFRTARFHRKPSAVLSANRAERQRTGRRSGGDPLGSVLQTRALAEIERCARRARRYSPASGSRRATESGRPHYAAARALAARTQRDDPQGQGDGRIRAADHSLGQDRYSHAHRSFRAQGLLEQRGRQRFSGRTGGADHHRRSERLAGCDLAALVHAQPHSAARSALDCAAAGVERRHHCRRGRALSRPRAVWPALESHRAALRVFAFVFRWLQQSAICSTRASIRQLLRPARSASIPACACTAPTRRFHCRG